MAGRYRLERCASLGGVQADAEPCFRSGCTRFPVSLFTLLAWSHFTSGCDLALFLTCNPTFWSLAKAVLPHLRIQILTQMESEAQCQNKAASQSISPAMRTISPEMCAILALAAVTQLRLPCHYICNFRIYIYFSQNLPQALEIRHYYWFEKNCQKYDFSNQNSIHIKERWRHAI